MNTYDQQKKLAECLDMSLVCIPSLSDQEWGVFDDVDHSGFVPWNKGMKYDDDLRQIIKESKKDMIPHPNSLKNLEKNDYWKGKKQSPEMIANRMKNMYGRVVSDETRQKISEKAKNYKHMLGKTHSEDTKAKMREASKRRWKSSK